MLTEQATEIKGYLTTIVGNPHINGTLLHHHDNQFNQTNQILVNLEY